MKLVSDESEILNELLKFEIRILQLYFYFSEIQYRRLPPSIWAAGPLGCGVSLVNALYVVTCHSDPLQGRIAVPATGSAVSRQPLAFSSFRSCLVCRDLLHLRLVFQDRPYSMKKDAGNKDLAT